MGWSGLVLAVVFVAQSPDAASHSQETPLSALEGRWRIHGDGSQMEIRACEDQPDSACGYLIHLGYTLDQRDYKTSDLWTWGDPLCQKQILSHIEPGEASGFTARYYQAHKGSHVLARIETQAAGLEVFLYPGVTEDEVIDYGISALIDGGVGVISTASLATRALIGEDHLGHDETWPRALREDETCQPPGFWE
ncbi:hypothetical protein [Woodsholea maritima]|uniref:hypothetical protein n=1 Tax=Woodsholea maritima TaxID=240237 RepID=UPI0012E9E68F|nr:hypothetical protein [Woodsholea maritima]